MILFPWFHVAVGLSDFLEIFLEGWIGCHVFGGEVELKDPFQMVGKL